MMKRKSREEISGWLKGPVAANLARWERRRQWSRRFRLLRVGIYGALAVALLMWLRAADAGVEHVVLFVMVLCVVASLVELGFAALQGSRRKSGAYTMELVDPAVEFLYPGFLYDPHYGLEGPEYLMSKLFPSVSNYESAHLLAGEVDGWSVRLSEVKIYDVTGTIHRDRNTVEVTTYHRGLLLETELPGVGEERVMVRPRNPEEVLGRRGESEFVRGGEQPPTWNEEKWTGVRVDHEEFREHYLVYASRPEAAGALLGEELIQELLALREAEDPDERMVFLSWCDDKLYVARRFDRPMLVPAATQSLLEPGWVEGIQEDVGSVFSLVRVARQVAVEVEEASEREKKGGKEGESKVEESWRSSPATLT